MAEKSANPHAPATSSTHSKNDLSYKKTSLYVEDLLSRAKEDKNDGDARANGLLLANDDSGACDEDEEHETAFFNHMTLSHFTQRNKSLFRYLTRKIGCSIEPDQGDDPLSAYGPVKHVPQVMIDALPTATAATTTVHRHHHHQQQQVHSATNRPTRTLSAKGSTAPFFSTIDSYELDQIQQQNHQDVSPGGSFYEYNWFVSGRVKQRSKAKLYQEMFAQRAGDSVQTASKKLLQTLHAYDLKQAGGPYAATTSSAAAATAAAILYPSSRVPSANGGGTRSKDSSVSALAKERRFFLNHSLKNVARVKSKFKLSAHSTVRENTCQ